MQFNSLDFAIFLPLVLLVYWWIGCDRPKQQNLLLIFASGIFYAWWDWRFLILIFTSIVVDYLVGVKLSNTEKSKRRKLWLSVSLLTNLVLLGFFKYFNFFLTAFSDSFSFLGMNIQTGALNILLPVGISFYTFQTMSYSIDVYRRRILPTRDFISFATFVSFFPQLVAGPIERASHLLPQFIGKRYFDYNQSVQGLRLILWGLFKKIVIADNAAVVVNDVFGHSQEYSGSTMIIGLVFFSFQIYGDFSGYTDIAIGTARLFGIDLKQNFRFPFFAYNVADFWRRWHISLSTWFRDYVYFPMGGSLGGSWRTGRNIFLVFVVSGLWHGANWTFMVWGLLHAIYIMPSILKKKKQVPNSSFKLFIQMVFTFALITLAWVFFRAETIHQSFDILGAIFSKTIIELPFFIGMRHGLVTAGLITIFVLIEWVERDSEYVLASLSTQMSRPLRWACYYLIALVIFWFSGLPQQFVYFQF